MTTTLEKSARAAYDELCCQNDEAGELLFIGDGSLLARAVLMAVRDDENVAKMVYAVEDRPYNDWKEIWSEQIDAILADGEEGK